MIRQVCSHCFRTVELPDTAAGQTVPCPKCEQPLSVAAAYSPGVAEGGGLAATVLPTPSPLPRPGADSPMTDPAAPPPGFKSEPHPAAAPLPPGTTPAPDPVAGYGRGVAFPFKAGWLDWVPAACVLLAFVLTFFPWVEMKLGGYTILNQSGWEAAFGGKGGNVPEKEARVEAIKVTEGTPATEKVVTGPTADTWTKFEEAITPKSGEQKPAALQGSLLLIFYLVPFLLIAVVLFAAERVITDPAKLKLPPALAVVGRFWPWRLAVLGGLALLLLLLVWAAALQGFGLQHSADKYARAKYQTDVENPNLTDNQKRAVWVAVGQEQGKYPVTPTPWLRLVLVLHGLAVLALLVRFWQATRGHKPPPRVAVQW